ncbi:MAG: hypothetical protein JWO31_1718 [Phycisphaerales bacterium]|nr:hypothetical protein [Phycisphaerales bacterium]
MIAELIAARVGYLATDRLEGREILLFAAGGFAATVAAVWSPRSG